MATPSSERSAAETKLSPRAFVILFAFGAISLTLLDSIHVHTGTLAYAHPVAFGSAWWVPLLMGSAVSGGGATFVAGWDRLGGPRTTASNASLVRGGVLFAALYAMSGLLPASSPVKLVLIAIGAAVIFRDVDGTRAGAILMLVGALLGTVAEAINPGFHYLVPDVFGVPIWLPALYACASPFVGQLARRFAEPERAPAS